MTGLHHHGRMVSISLLLSMTTAQTPVGPRTRSGRWERPEVVQCRPEAVGGSATVRGGRGGEEGGEEEEVGGAALPHWLSGLLCPGIPWPCCSGPLSTPSSEEAPVGRCLSLCQGLLRPRPNFLSQARLRSPSCHTQWVGGDTEAW